MIYRGAEERMLSGYCSISGKSWILRLQDSWPYCELGNAGLLRIFDLRRPKVG